MKLNLINVKNVFKVLCLDCLLKKKSSQIFLKQIATGQDWITFDAFMGSKW